MADYRALRRAAWQNRSLFAVGEIETYLARKGRAQQVIDRLSPLWNLCANCRERPRISETICLCEKCYQEVLPEILAAEQDGYAATDERDGDV